MCKIVDDYAARQAREYAAKQAKEIAFKLWNYGFRDFDKIADLTELPLDEVKEMFNGETA